jgi:hypothetical protein
MTAARRMQLARLGVWIGLATVAVLTAAITARTETGVRRIASLLSHEAPEPVRAAKAPAQLAARPSDQEMDQRRINEAIRTLTADRDRLLMRVGALERNLDDVTGSIPPAAGAPAAQPPSMPPAGTSLTVAPRIPPQAAPASPQATPQSPGSTPNRVAAGHLATGNPAAAESVATKTEFGIDIGSNNSVEGLRTLWTALKSAQPALFEGLRPVIAVRDGLKPGSIELRLVAGPLANAGIAARLCATLSAAGQSCQPAVFDGQRLALQ